MMMNPKGTNHGTAGLVAYHSSIPTRLAQQQPKAPNLGLYLT
jgi:hypothetical protein